MKLENLFLKHPSIIHSYMSLQKQIWTGAPIIILSEEATKADSPNNYQCTLRCRNLHWPKCIVIFCVWKRELNSTVTQFKSK